MTLEIKKTKATITSTILLASMMMVVIQVTVAEDSFNKVYAGSFPGITEGDILVGIEDLSEGGPGTVLVNPITGLQTIFTTSINIIKDMKGDSAGDIIVAHQDGVSRVNSITGAENAIANSGDVWINVPIGMDLDSSGNIILLDDDDEGNGLVISVDPLTGAEMLVIIEAELEGSNDIAIQSSGDILLLNDGQIFKVDPITGTHSLFASDVLGGLDKMAINTAGDIFTAGVDVVKIDPSTANPTLISSGFGEITGFGIESDGSLILIEAGESPTVYRVDAISGEQTILSSDNFFTNAQATTLAVYQSISMNPDTDGDGIYNEIDLLPTGFSNDFDDTPIGGTSDGMIVVRGDQVLTITEEVNPLGIKVNADISGGVIPATVQFCSAMSLINFDPGDESVVTCSSVTVDAIGGTLEITFFAIDNTEANTIMTQGNSITFEQDTFSFSAPTTNSETVIISVNGKNTSIIPGSTVSIPLQTANPDSDPSLRWVNGIGDSPCTDINTFNCVDETVRDDSDYIQTIGLGKNNSDKQFYTLSDIIDPITSSGHVLKYTISEAGIGVNPVKLDVILRQGQTVIASFHHENLPTGLTLIEQTLTAAQADSITDYSDLELTLDGNCDNTCKNSPGNREKIQVSWIEFAIMATS